MIRRCTSHSRKAGASANECCRRNRPAGGDGGAAHLGVSLEDGDSSDHDVCRLLVDMCSRNLQLLLDGAKARWCRKARSCMGGWTMWQIPCWRRIVHGAIQGMLYTVEALHNATILNVDCPTCNTGIPKESAAKRWLPGESDQLLPAQTAEHTFTTLHSAASQACPSSSSTLPWG